MNLEPLTAEEVGLVTQYCGLVSSVVGRMLRCGLSPSGAVDRDDLQSAGMVGLINAVRNRDEQSAQTFRAYAAIRIRGAVLDELRRMDWIGRRTRANVSELAKTRSRLEGSLGREATDAEMREALGLTDEQYRSQSMAARVSLLSLDAGDDGLSLVGAVPDPNALTSAEHLDHKDQLETLREHVSELPEREQRAIQHYYFDGWTLAAIGEVLEVTDAAVWYMLNRALSRLRGAFTKQAA